jgi:hypothetical protein
MKIYKKRYADIQTWTTEKYHCNFPIFAKDAVINEGDEDNLPDIWKYLSGKEL